MLEPLRKVAGPLTKALVLDSYFCKTFVMISLVLLDLYDTLQFWVFIGEGWGGNDPLNKICEDTFQQYPGDMYSHVMAKFGENRSLESWRNVIWFWRQKNGFMRRVRAPNFDIAELIAPNNLCFPTSSRHLPFRFLLLSEMFVYLWTFLHMYRRMSSNGV